MRRGWGVVTSTDREIEQARPELVILRGPSAQDDRRTADPPLIAPVGMPPDRLIALAGLSPAQALEIGADLLAALVRRPDHDTHGLADRVMIGMDGRVVLGREQPGSDTATSSASGPPAAGVGAVLAEWADAARRRAHSGDRLLAELERAIALVPLVDLPVVARTLDDACAAIDRDGVRAELSALVRAIAGASRAVTGSGPPVGAPSTEPLRPERSVGPRASGRGRVAIRRIGAWLLSVVVLATIVLLEFAFLRNDIVSDVHLLLDAGRSEAVRPAAPEPDGPPLPPPAPPTAGPVLAVDLRALDRCAPGAPCPMRVLVRLVPGTEPQTVTWSVRIVDRCTGDTKTVPGGTVVSAPGEAQATAVGRIPLPPAPSAVFVVTERPAVAAGPPVLVGSCAVSQPAG